jgi:polysaccharide export outer membrane protein
MPGLFFSTGCLLCLLVLASCSASKKINTDFLYFQKSMDSLETIQRTPVMIKANDLLTIQITSKSMNQEQVAIFNLPGNTTNGVSRGFQVNGDGYIDLPLLGDIKAAGLTREQLQAHLKDALSGFIKDPAVRVRFSDFNINVLGEVKIPGTHNFDKDRVTIIDAISAAGDLTDFGKRSNVMVIREEALTRKYYNIDLRSGTLFQSPAYLLEPNDIVYVNATERKLKTLNNNPDSQKGWQLAFGITSVITTVATLLITVINNNK